MMMIFWRWNLLPPPHNYPIMRLNGSRWCQIEESVKCWWWRQDETNHKTVCWSHQNFVWEQKLKCKCGCHQSPLIKTTDVPNTATLRQHRADQYDVWIPSQRTLPFPAWSGVGMFCGLCSGVKSGVSSDVKSGVLWCVKCGVRYNEEDWWPQLSKSLQFQNWTELHCFSALCMIYGDSSKL